MPREWKRSPPRPNSTVRSNFRCSRVKFPMMTLLRASATLRKIRQRCAYEAVEIPERLLKAKVEKLRLNMRPVTPPSLARELKISVATLYRRYGRTLVRQACQERPVCDEARAEVRYHING